MSKDRTSYHFKVQWRFPKSKATTADYVAGSLRELLALLKTQEDVGMGTTDYLCIHQIQPDGSVKELLIHELHQDGKHTFASDTENNVVPIQRALIPMKNSEKIVNDSLARIARKDKPRIKAGQGKIVRAGYRYVAIEAVPT